MGDSIRRRGKGSPIHLVLLYLLRSSLSHALPCGYMGKIKHHNYFTELKSCISTLWKPTRRLRRQKINKRIIDGKVGRDKGFIKIGKKEEK